MDKISIIIPVYNVESYLDECIQSVIKQSYTNLEILLIDDGSTDKSGEICDSYKIQDDRIKVIHKKNGGLSDARNVGIEAASGSYIGFVDSDDYIDKDMYEVLYRNIIQYNADISMCKARLVDNQKIIKDTFHEDTVQVFDTKKDILQAIYLGHGASIAVPLKLYKKEIFFHIRFPVAKTYEDAFVSWPIIKNAKRMVLQEISKYNYRQRAGSITHAKKYTQNILDVMEAYQDNYNAISVFDKNLAPIALCRVWWSYRIALGRIYGVEKNEFSKTVIKNIRSLIWHDWCKMMKNPYMSRRQLLIMVIVYFTPSLYLWLYRKYTT
ncbi:glycosyltransferase family 2 protein [Butyricicoccus intestinisimiae]|jgi:glycosyltransferase involved in cell wall biosynthesis|uniref:glycosyltransferase family 2 protein n=1 Tax=Butyricicoccus intestinisimiae TaxID=2841509 RepID=UPI003D8D37C4